MDVNIYIYRDTTHDGDHGLCWEADDADGFLTDGDLADVETMSEFKAMIRELYITATEDDDFDDLILEIYSESDLPFEVEGEGEFEDSGWGDDLDE